MANKLYSGWRFVTTNNDNPPTYLTSGEVGATHWNIGGVVTVVSVWDGTNWNRVMPEFFFRLWDTQSGTYASPTTDSPGSDTTAIAMAVAL